MKKRHERGKNKRVGKWVKFKIKCSLSKLISKKTGVRLNDFGKVDFSQVQREKKGRL